MLSPSSVKVKPCVIMIVLEKFFIDTGTIYLTIDMHFVKKRGTRYVSKITLFLPVKLMVKEIA